MKLAAQNSTSLTEAQLRRELECIRRSLDKAFQPDTSCGRKVGAAPSAGHCAAVATILHALFGGQLLRAMVAGESHWFNRFQLADRVVDVDLTADQFGLSPVAISGAGRIHASAVVRQSKCLRLETRARARLLAHRAGL